ncbi:MAG TPA: glycosyltransferase family 9 protein [Chthoniobacterales bacterium]|nr:glycosyltransferase family 9 protein [Chthoniobacterales bacterium]
MKRILVIRGGAIGDFVLTLPAIKLLRDNFSRARLEVLGYPNIIALAEKRYYADAICSIESAMLARFFVRDADLPSEWVVHFGTFDLIVSYLFDPDGIFENNVKRCGSMNFVAGPAKLGNQEHAACQLARPLERLGLFLQDPAARIYPSGADRKFARGHLSEVINRIVVLHPGSGSETKSWPIEKWEKLGEHLVATNCKVIVVSGEAEEGRIRLLKAAWKEKPIQFAESLPLPQLAALVESATFIGHDSGISHIAAAVGARCILLFGPTDPRVWAPANENVSVIRAPNGNLDLLAVNEVISAITR